MFSAFRCRRKYSGLDRFRQFFSVSRSPAKQTFYRDFSDRVQLLSTKGLSKPDRIRELIKGTLGKITKTETMAKCPAISQAAVQRTLIELQRNNEIIKLSGVRYTASIWNRGNE